MVNAYFRSPAYRMESTARREVLQTCPWSSPCCNLIVPVETVLELRSLVCITFTDQRLFAHGSIDKKPAGQVKSNWRSSVKALRVPQDRFGTEWRNVLSAAGFWPAICWQSLPLRILEALLVGSRPRSQPFWCPVTIQRAQIGWRNCRNTL